MNTDLMVKELLNRIGDFEKDPEPVHDAFLEEIPIHVRLHLKYVLQECYNAFNNKMNRS